MVGDEHLKRHVFILWDPNFNLPTSMAAHLEVQYMRMWDLMLIELYYASELLNPFLMNIMDIQKSGTAKRTLNRVVQKLSGPLGVDFNEVMNEFT